MPAGRRGEGWHEAARQPVLLRPLPPLGGGARAVLKGERAGVQQGTDPLTKARAVGQPADQVCSSKPPPKARAAAPLSESSEETLTTPAQTKAGLQQRPCEGKQPPAGRFWSPEAQTPTRLSAARSSAQQC